MTVATCLRSCDFLHVDLMMIAVTQVEMQALQAIADGHAQQAASIASQNAARLAGVAATGVDSASVATGRYSWSTVNIENSASSGPGLTNGDCNLILTNISTSQGQLQFQSSVASQLAKVLPISAGGVVFPHGITCVPADPQQTLKDQAAYFVFNGMEVSGIYTLFAQNAAYVTLPTLSPSQLSLQTYSESTSPLSQEVVLTALQSSVRVAFFEVMLQIYRLFKCVLIFRVSH